MIVLTTTNLPISKLPIQQSTMESILSSNMSHSRSGRELNNTASLNSEYTAALEAIRRVRLNRALRPWTRWKHISLKKKHNFDNY